VKLAKFTFKRSTCFRGFSGNELARGIRIAAGVVVSIIW
jgi:hypothetical protein